MFKKGKKDLSKKDLEKQISELATQNVKLSQAVLQLANVVKEFDPSLRSLCENMAVNRFLLEDILKNKLNLSTPEVELLLENAKESIRKAHPEK